MCSKTIDLTIYNRKLKKVHACRNVAGKDTSLEITFAEVLLNPVPEYAHHDKLNPLEKISFPIPILAVGEINSLPSTNNIYIRPICIIHGLDVIWWNAYWSAPPATYTSLKPISIPGPFLPPAVQMNCFKALVISSKARSHIATTSRRPLTATYNVYGGGGRWWLSDVGKWLSMITDLSSIGCRKIYIYNSF